MTKQIFEPTHLEKMRGLPWSIGGSVSITIFNQFTFFGSGYVLFLSEMGFNKSEIGFLLSLLSFLGVLALLVPSFISRLGFKRAFIRFWSLRNLTPGFLVVAPFFLDSLGLHSVFLYVAMVMIVFGLFRSVAETALLSWQQEYIPRSIQGKFFATSNFFVSLVGILAVSIASYIIGSYSGLGRFSFLFLVAVFFGQLSAWLFTYIPGGVSPTSAPKTAINLSGLRIPAHDSNFLRFLWGVTLIIIGTGSLGSFMPLYMRDEIGLNDGKVVLLQTGTLIGGLISSYFWGWTADRYGSRPVMLSGIYLLALLPIIWFFLPSNSPLSYPVALTSYFLMGMASLGWGIGLTRLFFVSVVPPEKKADYMALYYACVSLMSGLSALIGGWILEFGEKLSKNIQTFSLNPYLLLFVIGVSLPLISIALFSNVKADSELTTSQFAGLFLRGNPILAVKSLFSFRSARDERTMVASTESLGKAQSPLTVDELLSALSDPRFNVRFEAIVSIARRSPDDRLLDALAQILADRDPALGVIAAWALGRVGDPRAIEPLRRGLHSPYRSVQVHCARSLGALKDVESIPLLLERLQSENDKGLQLAYACALGHLGESRALLQILNILRVCDDETVCGELALSVGRILGIEHTFIQLLRQIESETGSAFSNAVTRAQKHIRRLPIEVEEINFELTASAQQFARNNLDAGIISISNVIKMLLTYNLQSTQQEVLIESLQQLKTSGFSQKLYLVLAICTLEVCELDIG